MANELISVARAIMKNPAVTQAVERGTQVRDLALQAQTAVLSTLNLPTAADLGAVASKLRSISQRLELLEDSLARIDRTVTRLPNLIEKSGSQLVDNQ